MSTFILCPECGDDLGSLSMTFQLLHAKHNEICLTKNTQIDPSCVELKPEVIEPIDYILDMLGLQNECCRMRLLCYVDFDNIYKIY